MSRTIEVSLPDDLVKRVDQRVRERGTDRDRAIQELIERGLKQDAFPQAGMTVAELLSRAAGPSPADAMSDEELSQFIDGEIREYRAEKRKSARNG